jgi:hypothetical protein
MSLVASPLLQEGESMTRWKWDAEPNDPLNRYRIPVTAHTPFYSYVACFDKDSPHRPTNREIEQICSFIDEHKAHWFTTMEREQSSLQPFDTQLGHNSVIFHKYGTADWGYRRKSWPHPRFTPPSPRVPTRAMGPMILLEVMELIHNGNDSQSIHWRQWKADHPEVFS